MFELVTLFTIGLNVREAQTATQTQLLWSWSQRRSALNSTHQSKRSKLVSCGGWWNCS